MKKHIYLVSLMLIVFLAAGFSCGKSDEAVTTDENSGQAVENQNEDSIIDDFKNALNLNQKMKCTYKVDSQGERFESTSYFQGDKYRTEYEANGVKYTTVFDGETMYTWDENTKQGTKMELACLDDIEAVQADEEADDSDYEEYQTSAEVLDAGVDVSCRKVASIDFSIPSDVEFVDQCELLKQQMEALENIQSQLPDLEGLDIPEY